MSRPVKYSTPEIKAVGKAYSTIKKQKEDSERLIKLLGGKCTLCGDTNIKVLVADGPRFSTWEKTKNGVAKFPQLFSLRCANCDRATVYDETLKRLEGYHATLYQDSVRLTAERKASEEAKEAKAAAAEVAEREKADYEREQLRRLRQSRADEIEAQLAREQEENAKCAAQEAARQGFGS